MPEAARPLPPEETRAPGVRHPPHLIAAIGCGAGAIAVVLLAGFAVDRWPFGFDRAVMLALRQPGDLAQPIGPGWLHAAIVDVTALGGATVLTLVVLASLGLLIVRRLWLTAALVAAGTASGSLLVAQAKLLFARPRPGLVDHLVQASGMSFPSGHAANSAVVYLTLALLVSQVAHGRAVRRYLVAVAVLLVGAIGCTRVYLGVHWPSDVLAGWSFGTLWALAWWFAGARARGLLAEQPPGGLEVRRVDHPPV